LGGAIGFAGFLQKFFTFLTWRQLTGLLPRKPSFLDEPFAYRPILFEPVAFHERPPVVNFRSRTLRLVFLAEHPLFASVFAKVK
jgi:hypothetical protein